ncbi:hypothetical protein RR48_01236 [Papilio machaon]|uniref:Uncharacterized protein n=1 Tax=Papilio machaon TaxID=76193 RepID=A0A0N1PJ16_PAPMA|nr:hypothetical protein RR48_01236 [Papilio machaon]
MAEQQAVPDPRHPEAPRPPGAPLVVSLQRELEISGCCISPALRECAAIDAEVEEKLTAGSATHLGGICGGLIRLRVQTSRLLDVGVEAVVDNVPEFAQEVVIADNIEQVAPEVVQAPILVPADVLPASPPRHDFDREPQPLRCNICATNPLEVVLIPCVTTRNANLVWTVCLN